MMYNAGLVGIVKCNGRILREDKELVYLPFNSEYSILLKNLDTRKCVAQISIDGIDVLDNQRVIIYPNSQTEVEGFLNRNIIKNKFKFIKKTDEIFNYRGDRIDDGIIRIEYWFEKSIPVYTTFYNSYPCFLDYGPSSLSSSCYLNNISSSNTDPGITVKGSEVNQSVRYDKIDKLEYPSKVIILKLIGINNNGKEVKQPLTIQTKKICETCGRKSKSYIKYCQNCGTFLE